MRYNFLFWQIIYIYMVANMQINLYFVIIYVYVHIYIYIYMHIFMSFTCVYENLVLRLDAGLKKVLVYGRNNDHFKYATMVI